MNALKRAFEVGPGIIEDALHSMYLEWTRPDLNVTTTPLTVTANSGTLAFGNKAGSVGSYNRGCATMVGGGAAANGHNFCMGTANFMFSPGKRVRIKFDYFDEAMGVSAFALGMHTVSTAISEAWKSGGTPPANGVDFVKRATATTFDIWCQKASGGAIQYPCTPATGLLSSIWYDYDILITPHASIAGQAQIDVWRADNGGAFVSITPGGLHLTNLPDSVVLALGFQFQAGDTGTTLKGCLSRLLWQVER
jgi:hypothetical protein